LPIELGYTLKTADNVREFRITGCQWNLDIDPAMFEATPPPGYIETAPPE
jgi:hypothetical protein